MTVLLVSSSTLFLRPLFIQLWSFHEKNRLRFELNKHTSLCEKKNTSDINSSFLFFVNHKKKSYEIIFVMRYPSLSFFNFYQKKGGCQRGHHDVRVPFSCENSEEKMVPLRRDQPLVSNMKKEQSHPSSFKNAPHHKKNTWKKEYNHTIEFQVLNMSNYNFYFYLFFFLKRMHRIIFYASKIYEIYE